MKIIFLGTPEFAVESLAKIVDAGYDVAAVVTMPDKPAGRGHKLLQSPVKQYALEKGIPVLQPPNLKDPEFIKELNSYEADLFVVIAFRMLPREVWQMPRLGTFNLHASLLPKYRGAAPINRAVMNGETETGVTTFFLKHEIDTGDMIAQKSIEIGEDENVGSVHDRLMALGAEMVVETLHQIESGDLHLVPQPEGDHIPAPKIFKEDCKLNHSYTARQLHNQIRGLSPYPAAWDEIRPENAKPLNVKVFESRISDIPASDALWMVKDNRLYTKASDLYLEILEIQPSGKRRMSTEEFLRGYKI